VNWFIALGIGLLLLDGGITFLLRERIDPRRLSLYTLPLFVLGAGLLVIGIIGND
jgi:hypothetical protein